MTGVVVGTFVVLDYAGKKNWRIRCACGSERVIEGVRIRNANLGKRAVRCHHQDHEPLRFDEKVDRSGDCWVWTGASHGDGYGSFKLHGRNGRTVLAHKWNWERINGAVPEGLELDHVCRNRACVRPEK